MVRDGAECRPRAQARALGAGRARGGAGDSHFPVCALSTYLHPDSESVANGFVLSLSYDGLMPTITFRLKDSELAELRQRARVEDKSVSQVVREAVGLAADSPDVSGRLEAVEKRLDRLEELAGL